MKILEFNTIGIVVLGIKMKNIFSVLFLFLAIQCNAAWYPNYFTTNANPTTLTGGLVSNAFNITFAADTLYTNTSGSYLQAVATAAIPGSDGNVRQMSFYVDTNADGGWDITRRHYAATTGGTTAYVDDMGAGAFMPPGSVFMWTNTIGTLGVLDAASGIVSYFTTGGSVGPADGSTIFGLADGSYEISATNGFSAINGVVVKAEYVNDGQFIGNNFYAGHPGNYILPGEVGCFIAGGVTNTTSALAYTNAIFDRISTIAGGVGNRIGFGSEGSFIGAGEQCIISDDCTHSVIVGGEVMSIGAVSEWAAMIGGHNNSILSGSGYSVLIGGGFNTNSGGSNLMGGGQQNKVIGNSSVLLGGDKNSIAADYAVILGGLSNNVTAIGATVIGNRITNSLPYSTAIGGSGGTFVVSSNGVATGNGSGISSVPFGSLNFSGSGSPSVTTNVSWWTNPSNLTGQPNAGNSGLSQATVTLNPGATTFRGSGRLYTEVISLAVTNLFTLDFGTNFPSPPVVFFTTTYSNTTATATLLATVRDVTTSNALIANLSGTIAAGGRVTFNYLVVP